MFHKGHVSQNPEKNRVYKYESDIKEGEISGADS